MFRLAETLRIADPRTIEKKLPQSLIVDWLQYFYQKDRKFDKLEFYFVQLSTMIGGIAGVKDTASLIWERDERMYGDTGSGGKEKVTAEQAEKVLRMAFGV